MKLCKESFFLNDFFLNLTCSSLFEVRDRKLAMGSSRLKIFAIGTSRMEVRDWTVASKLLLESIYE